MIVDILCVIIFVLVTITILFTPYDETIYRRRYIGRVVTEYDGDDNPYTSQSRYLGVERTVYSVYVAGIRRTLSYEERCMTDEELVSEIQKAFW